MKKLTMFAGSVVVWFALACGGGDPESNLVGTWESADGNGATLTFDGSGWVQTPPTNIKGINTLSGSYEVKSVEGEKLILGMTLEGDGKSFPVDDKSVTFTDTDTIDVRNTKNNMGGVWFREGTGDGKAAKNKTKIDGGDGGPPDLGGGGKAGKGKKSKGGKAGKAGKTKSKGKAKGKSKGKGKGKKGKGKR